MLIDYHHIQTQNAVLNSDKVTELYDQSLALIQKKVETFTNTASGLEVDHCITLYLNIAKYEPLKGSSYIPLPKPLADKKAIINVKNKDNKCLLHAINSAINPASTHVDRLSSYPNINYLKINGIDFPTPISQIPKLEKTKQSCYKCLWIRKDWHFPLLYIRSTNRY